MEKLTLGVRIFLGLIFFIFGLNGFFNFIPVPPMDEQAGAFMGALVATGYFFPMVKIVEIICGALLLFGAFVPLALVSLAPIIINIFFFHAFLAMDGLPMALVIGAAEIYLAFFSKQYAPIIKHIFRCPKLEAMQGKK